MKVETIPQTAMHVANARQAIQKPAKWETVTMNNSNTSCHSETAGTWPVHKGNSGYICKTHQNRTSLRDSRYTRYQSGDDYNILHYL
jgi:hypothetical protein